MAATTRNADERRVTFELKGWSRPNMPYNEFKVKPVGDNGDLMLVDRKDVRNNHGLKHPARKDRSSLGLNPAWLDPPEGVNIQKDDDFPFWGDRIYEDIRSFNESNTKRRRVLFYDIRHGEADHNKWKKKFLEDALKDVSKESSKKSSKKLSKRPWNKWADTYEYRKWPIFQYPEGSGKFYCVIDPPLTEKGRKDAEKAKKIFKKLKNRRFPMPKAVHISPLYRTVQTFALALENDFGIDTNKCWVVEWLREQETGNSADILMKEFLSGERAPPPPGSGICEKWMEPDGKDGYSKDLKARVDTYFKELPKFDESDCIARVTHSLLNRHTLMSLEVGKGKHEIKVMNSFMLEEGGVFAYVLEMDKADKSRPNLKWTKYRKYKDAMGPRRRTAFTGPGNNLNLDNIKKDFDDNKDFKFGIEAKAFEIAKPIYEQNIERMKLDDKDHDGESQMKVGNGNAISLKTNVAQDGHGDRRTRIGTKETIHRMTNANNGNTVARRKGVPERKKTGVNKNDGSKRNTAAIHDVDGGRNVGSRRTTGANKNDDSKINTAAIQNVDGGRNVGSRRPTGANKNDDSKINTAAIQNVDGGVNIGSRRTTGANNNADRAGNTGSNTVVGSNINRQRNDQRRTRQGGSVREATSKSCTSEFGSGKLMNKTVSKMTEL